LGADLKAVGQLLTTSFSNTFPLFELLKLFSDYKQC
jgi:hypothetical protein